MADENDVDGMEDGMQSPAEKKGKGGSIILTILKWVAIIVGSIILIGAVSAITYKLISKNDTASLSQVVPVSEDATEKREVLSWYNSIGQTKAKTKDGASVVVEVVLGYKKDDKITSTEITSRTIEIKDYLRRYFSMQTVESVVPENEKTLQIEIKNNINSDILTESQIKDVRFLSLEVIES